jgi:hypothetical protein
MIKFQQDVDKNNIINGQLRYENYPVNLKNISEEYFIDRFIKSFEPFLEIQKPIEKFQDNIWHFRLQLSDRLFQRFNLKFFVRYPNKLHGIQILFQQEEDNSVSIEYENFYSIEEKYASRKRYREEVEEEEFLQNVLNAMTRLLNTIIKDYTMMSSSVLRNGTGKFLGRAETRVAEFIGANRSIVKDG